MKKQNPDKKIPIQSKEVLWKKNFDGSIAILKLDETDFYFSLDGIAAEVWAHMDGKKPIAEISAKLIKKYSPPFAKFQADVAKLLDTLVKEQLITFS